MVDRKGRPTQPRCPACGKALYKRMDAGQVLATDSYAWCRNQACAEYNKDQSGTSTFTPLTEHGVKRIKSAAPRPLPKSETKKKSPAPAAPAIEAQPAPVPVIEAQPAPSASTSTQPAARVESAAVAKARARIRTVVEAAQSQFGVNAVGLALALVSQETGDQEAANALIREYNLTELFGILPR